MKKLIDLEGTGSVIAIDKQKDVYMKFNTADLRGYNKSIGNSYIGIFYGN